MNSYSQNKGNVVIGILIIVLIIWGLFSFFKSDDKQGYNNSPSSSFSSKKDCSSLEPSNPYDEGSGHYAGFEWGENGNSCGGNSNSFIEGCEDYEAQEEAYNSCMDGQ